MLEIAKNWEEYQLLDTGDKDKLERWKDVVLIRPDPQSIWHKEKEYLWKNYDGKYTRSDKGGGSWSFRKPLSEYWTINYKELKFKVSPTNFKHTGIFPEQAINWDFIYDKIKNSNREVKVLNLFAYTGCATMMASFAGASEVVHVDASKGMVSWAKENMELNNLQDHTIRFIVDDCLKFIEREIRRDHHYDIIIMDPPSYGRGPNNELWKLEDQLEILISQASKLLSDNPLAFLVNGYTTGFSSVVIENLIKRHVLSKYPDGKVYSVELALPICDSNLLLPAGVTGRFER